MARGQTLINLFSNNYPLTWQGEESLLSVSISFILSLKRKCPTGFPQLPQ
jgi:hypothetical protein